ncbi:MAG: hypothetical protein O9324_02395 [Microcystis sp. LE19-84.1B]|nr:MULTISPECIES: hypothetical protein [Microcystis]MCZ8222825.1 hypothetical protein [Microcystis sp. LE19-84.1B]
MTQSQKDAKRNDRVLGNVEGNLSSITAIAIISNISRPQNSLLP